MSVAEGQVSPTSRTRGEENPGTVEMPLPLNELVHSALTVNHRLLAFGTRIYSPVILEARSRT